MGRRRPLREARYAGSFPSQYVQVEGHRISLRLFKRSDNRSTACCVRNWITINRRKIGGRTDARKLAGHGLDVCYASIKDCGLSPIFSSGGCLHWVGNRPLAALHPHVGYGSVADVLLQCVRMSALGR